MRKRALAVPAQLSLVQVRVGFLLLGVALLTSLLVLSLLAARRLEEASRDREAMVASRVFDELEREVSTFLDEESERPPYQNLANTDPQAWAPFVVGYFKQNGLQVDHVAADGATSENHRRILWAIAEAAPTTSAGTQNNSDLPAGGGPRGENEQGLDVGFNSKVPPVPKVAPGERPVAGSAPAFAPPEQKKEASGSEIIESLNRAPVRRKQGAAPADKNAEVDQFSDYAERF